MSQQTMTEGFTNGLSERERQETEAELRNAYREARVAIRHQVAVEKEVVASASVMWTDSAAGAENTEAFQPIIDRRTAPLLDEVKAAYELQARQRDFLAGEFTPLPLADLMAVLRAQEKAGTIRLVRR